MKTKQHYLALYSQNEAQICQHSQAVLNAPRAEAFATFEQKGFPRKGEEDYIHTDMAQAFALALPTSQLQTSSFEFSCSNANADAYIGGLADFAQKHPDIAARYYGKAALAERDCIAALNTMFVKDGFVIYIPKGVCIEEPIRLSNIFSANTDSIEHRRLLIILEAQAEAHLIITDKNEGKAKLLFTQVVEIFAEDGAVFDLYDLEENAALTTRFTSVFVQQATNSNVLVNATTLTNGRTRNNYYVDLLGENSEAMLCGMAIEDKEQEVDTFSVITHHLPYCTSHELFKNVLDDSALGAFSGRILVKEGADKTEAYQTNRNLCATDRCRMYSKPQLEIYADDVRCSHGMTTGQLDENAMFYLRSRGISKEEARMMLSVAFTADVIDLVRIESHKELLYHLVDKRLRDKLATPSEATAKDGE